MEYFKKYFSDIEEKNWLDEEVKVCCPFHDDNRPSASINTSKNLFHCWVCNIGYNEEQFIAKINNIPTTEAIKLLDKYKSLWAEYLVKYLKAYQDEGINIDYMTIQNEPKAAQFWESCQYTSKEEQELIKNHIFPAFKKNDINTKLLIWDHNKERVVYRAKEIFDDPEVKDMVAGIGYHYYSGDYFENIKTFKELYPDKLAIHTEGCTGYELLWFRKRKRRVPNAEIYAHDIIGDLNNGANGYIDWNMMLDYHGGPTHIHNRCNSPIMLTKKGNDYTKNLPYYYIGHFSRFIKPGAKRIAFSKFDDSLEVTSFKNPDESIAVVILNRGKMGGEMI